MYSNMKILILILLLFTGGSVIKAQRHYKRISALEGSYSEKLITWQIYHSQNTLTERPTGKPD
jgi:hypothetical protein